MEYFVFALKPLTAAVDVRKMVDGFRRYKSKESINDQICETM
jgi:hypothetical protein